jgi:hypothetical protein
MYKYRARSTHESFMDPGDIDVICFEFSFKFVEKLESAVAQTMLTQTQ